MKAIYETSIKTEEIEIGPKLALVKDRTGSLYRFILSGDGAFYHRDAHVRGGWDAASQYGKRLCTALTLERGIRFSLHGLAVLD